MQFLPPGPVGEIPLDGFTQSVLEAVARRPAKVLFDFRSVHRVTGVVARSVSHKCNQIGAVPDRSIRRQLVYQRADRSHYVDVGPFAAATDIVALADPAP